MFSKLSGHMNYLRTLDVVINTDSEGVMNWIVSHKNSYAEALPHSVILLGVRNGREVIKIKWDHEGGAIIW